MAQPYDDDFEEDGCTFDFSDEAEVTPGASNTVGLPGAVYRTYEGEDFAQYLKDDDDPMPSVPTWGYNRDERRPPVAPNEAETYARRRKSTEIIREKLGRLLPTPATARPKNITPTPQSYRIYDVSFADCKMGNTLILDGSGVINSAPGSDSGIDCRSGVSVEAESDLGPRTRSSWWNEETLSSRRQRRSSASTTDLRSVDHRLDPEGQLGRREFTDDSLLRGKQNLSEADKASDGSKRFSNTFRKIYNTISRRKSANTKEMSYVQNIEDIRL